MKKILFIILCLPLLSVAQQLPNAGFETWNNSYTPASWNGFMFNYGIGIYTNYERTTDKHSGTYAIKVKTGDFFGQSVPGIISYGQIDLQNQTLEGGIAFSGQPSQLTGWYKYAPVQGDTMAIVIGFTQYNTQTHERDTIAAGFFFSSEASSSYQQFTADIIYIYDAIPDSLNLIIVSSGFAGHNGSAVLIDDLAFEYGQRILPTTCYAATDVGASGFVASWKTMDGATDYAITVATDANFEYILGEYAQKKVGNVNSITLDGLDPETTYYYMVQAIYGETSSWISNTIDVTTGVSALAGTLVSVPSSLKNHSFTANWQSNPLASGYYLQVASDELFQTQLVGYERKDVGAVNSWEISGLEQQTNYYYRVKCYDAQNISAWSDVMPVQTAFVESPIAMDGSYGSTFFLAQWATVSDAQGYLLDVSENDPDFTAFLDGYQDKDVGNVNSIAVNRDATNYASYYYRLRAYNENGISDYSNVITFIVNKASILDNADLFIQHTDNWLTVHSDKPLTGDLTIYSIDGKLHYTENLSNQNSVRIETSSCKQGIYLLRISTEHGDYLTKINLF